jgi:hypothetical protein
MNPTRAGAEQIAFDVDFHAIRHSRLVALEDGPDLASGNAVLPYREPTNVHLRCVVDEENRLFLSETQAVRPFKILDQSDDCAVPRIKSIDPPNRLLFLARDSHSKLRALARMATIGRVGEIKTTRGIHDDVVRTVELEAGIVARQRRHATIRLLPDDPTCRVFATDEPALAVDTIAVGLVAGRAKNLDPVRPGLKAVQAVARNIAEDEDAVVSAPNGTFREAKSARALHDRLVLDDVRQP